MLASVDLINCVQTQTLPATFKVQLNGLLQERHLFACFVSVSIDPLFYVISNIKKESCKNIKKNILNVKIIR